MLLLTFESAATDEAQMAAATDLRICCWSQGEDTISFVFDCDISAEATYLVFPSFDFAFNAGFIQIA